MKQFTMPDHELWINMYSGFFHMALDRSCQREYEANYLFGYRAEVIVMLLFFAL